MSDKKPKTIICDLDGTLCNTEHRQHYMLQDKKDWNSFYGELVNDKPNHWCAGLLQILAKDGYQIILVSGRPDNYKGVTIDWLQNFAIPYHVLFMRKAGDFRQDYTVKEEIYLNEIKDKWDVHFTIDDRKQVVDMWRRNNLICLQCAEGNF